MIVLRYWYLGPLKTKAAHFFSTLKVSAIYSVEICPVFLSLLCDVHIWIFKKFLAPDVCGVLQYYNGAIYLHTGAESAPASGSCQSPLIFQLIPPIAKPIFTFSLMF